VFVDVSITETEWQLEFVMYTYAFAYVVRVEELLTIEELFTIEKLFTIEELSTIEEFSSAHAVAGTSTKNKIKIVNIEVTERKSLSALILLPPVSFSFWHYSMYFDSSKSRINSTSSRQQRSPLS
jgi:hypothetical protein